MGHAFVEITGDDNDAGIAVIKSEFNGATLGVALFAPAHVVKKRVYVVALGEHATLLMQHVDVVDVPAVAFFGRAFLPPIDRKIGARLWVRGHVVGGFRAQLFQATRGNEAITREHVRAHEAARIEVVMLVPAVVCDFVAFMRLDHRE